MSIHLPKLSSLTLAASTVFASVYSTGASYADVSRSMKENISDLNILRQNAQAFVAVSKTTGLGKQTVEPEQALLRAEQALSTGHWLSALQESQRYLSTIQQPEPASWMKAQLISGKAYEERGMPGKASKAYLRYLATFMTSKESKFEELSDVLERLVRTSTKAGSKSKVELNQFLSSLSSMQVPDTMEPELRYFMSFSGAKIGQQNMALNWLHSDTEDNSRPDVRARALNLKALIAMNAGKWTEAEAALERIVSLDNLKSSAKDGARLSLARVNLRLKKPKTALNIYESFGKDSSVYRDALFEKTFVYIRQDQGSKARDSAIEYLAAYPEHPDSMQMRTIRSWLEIHSGDLNAAKGAIESTATHLLGIKKKVQELLYAKDDLKYNDVKNIITITRGLVTAPAELEDTLAMFEQMNDLHERLDEVDGMVLNVLYAFAKADLDRYRPELANRRQQIADLIEQYMKLAGKQVQMEQSRLEGRLTALDQQRMKTNDLARKQLFSQRAELAREAKRFITWIGPAEALSQLAQTWTRLQKTSLAHPALGHQNSGGDDNGHAKLANKLKNDMLASLKEIRYEQAKSIVEQSKMHGLMETFREYVQLIQTDQKIITAYEPDATQTLDLLDDTDSQTAWREIKNSGTLIDQSLQDLASEARLDLSNTLSQVNKLFDTKSRLESDINTLRSVLEQKAGSASAQILAHYDAVIDQRIAKQHKWSGDVDYLAYADQTEKQLKAKQKHELEMQILSDNLQILEPEAGKTWQK
jgi:tetratricopeptide (TPR) repeat protein